MKHFLFLFLILCAAACSAPSCKTNKTLRISFNTTPSTLDPRKSGDFVSSTLICMLYEGLTRCLPDGSPELALAEKIVISEDAKTYLFYLRKASWSDGKPISAFDFERSWKKILDPAFPSICAYLLFPIKNGEKCAQGKVPLCEAGIKALDDSTLCIELEKPAPYFLSLTSFPLFLPVPSESESAWEQKPSCLVTNGPFLLEKFTPHSEIVLRKNPYFWNKDQIDPDQIHIAILPDEITSLQMFEQGELDWLGGPFAPIPPDAVERLQKPHYISSAASTICSFNTETFPFQNEDLRKAFSYAIDRNEIIQKVVPPGQKEAKRCLPPSLFGGEEKEHFFQDKNLARAHFQKALSALSISPSSLEKLILYYKPGQVDSRLAQALQKQWKEILGITIQLRQVDFKGHSQLLQKREYQLALGSWISQFHDPVNLLDRFKNRNHLKNYPGWENSEFVSILDEAASTADPQTRIALLEKAENLLAEHVPVSPLYHWNNPSIHSQRIAEIAISPSGGILFERFRLNESPK